MSITIALNTDDINSLNLAPAQAVIEPLLQGRSIMAREQQLRFTVDYLREPNDPRELPEIPEVRLWFIRLDALYPWMPFLLDWKSGELSRYTAMLVPHQFHAKDGIQFNPEALEIFVMHKIFVLTNWLHSHGVEGTSRLKAMAKMFGYELDDGLFALIAPAPSR